MSNKRDLHRWLAHVDDKSISRREVIKRGSALGLSMYGLSAALGTVGSAPMTRALAAGLQDDASAGVRGGKLVVANIGEPPTLDVHQTTATMTLETMASVYETLMAYDENFQPQPMLAESLTVSDDGLTWTVALRQGVPFHNGEIMTAADVKASMDRWGQIAGVGKKLYAVVDEVEATDEHTITIELTAPFGTMPVALANSLQNCAIYPKSVIDAGGLEPIEAAIGTGPYKLAERKADAYIRMERFDDYAALEGGAQGYGGTKYAWADVIEFVPVSDMASRVAGLQAGDYLLHGYVALSNDQYDVLKDAPGLVTVINPPTEWPILFCNWEAGPMSNPLIREAVQATLDMEPMLQSAYGSSDFYQLDPSLMLSQTPWWTDAGSDRYDMKDPELGKQKLQEAGYDGTPIRFMSTQEYAYMYATSAVAVQQLEAIGFTIDHQVIDWASVVERRAKPEEWDMFVTSHPFVPDPTLISFIGGMGTYPGWWSDQDSLDAATQLLSLALFEERKPVWDQIQSNVFSQIPAIKVGSAATIRSYSDKIGGNLTQFELGLPYWNLWIEE